MSKTVDLQDAEAAIQLIEFAYFKKVPSSCVCSVDYHGSEDFGIVYLILSLNP